ncbi:D-xylose reductase [Didymosphaeria variabile]|uniref:D-xylose reductase n=1 Tax=Didymosphaeria variabile TaxID=1932322 RepID=A0A9W8XR48_9PLEO|nr:D-xylose reductase [Didymosphaeria variabile]KAJ4355730.1 D-xylose reductase [Didymosphaeria variabile]
MSIPSIELNDGNKMPQVGFGLWKVNNDTCADQVYEAIKAGYRLFDGACDYGNEVESGQGIARAINEGIVKREDLFITSKLWNSFHDPEQVEPIVKKQLGDWGIDYFDLYLIHFPVAIKYIAPEVRYPPGWFVDDAGTKIEHSKASLESTWKAIEQLKKKGLSKSVGISNYTGALLLDLFTYAEITPAVLQIEHHPYFTQENLVKLAKERGIAITAYSSFGPSSFIECDMKVAADTQQLLSHDLITGIAEKHSKTPAQVLLRWATQRGLAVIPKSNDPKRLAQNLDVVGFDLGNDEIQKISDLNINLKFNVPTNVGSIPFAVWVENAAN